MLLERYKRILEEDFKAHPLAVLGGIGSYKQCRLLHTVSHSTLGKGMLSVCWGQPPCPDVFLFCGVNKLMYSIIVRRPRSGSIALLFEGEVEVS